jgi:hypothetical protein
MYIIVFYLLENYKYFKIILSPIFSPSIAEEVIPPAYQAHSQTG